MKKIVSLFAIPMALASANLFAASINEIRVDDPGADDDEYVELVGSSNESLANLTYLVIGDGSGGNNGVIESVINLSAQTIPADGIFVFSKTATLLGGTVTSDFHVPSISFENNDNVTHLLVSGFTGSNGDDLDINDDGTLDTTPWTTVVESVGLKISDSGEQIYSTTVVGPNGSNAPYHIFKCESDWIIGNEDNTAPNSQDTPGAENDCSGGPVDPDPDPVSRTIPEIQSSSDASPFTGTEVTTSGIVTSILMRNGQPNGYFLQDVTGDSDTSTSDGIYVYEPNATVSVGDNITISATIAEFYGLTELKDSTKTTVNSSGNSLPTPTPVALPETTDGDLEQYEGMLVEITTPMTVSQSYFLGRYGQMTLASPDDADNIGRLFQPTNMFPANSPEALALADENQRRLLILDDGSDDQNPDTVPYLGKNPVAVIRAGDQVSGLVGVLDYGRINSSSPAGNDYRLHPTQAPVFTAINNRTEAPEPLDGTVRVASFNVLNYFTTIDSAPDSCGTNPPVRCRGADSSSEFLRQESKLVAAINSMNADVIGLIEIENNGFGAGSAIQSLVDALNADAGSALYSVLPVNAGATPGLGDDFIAVGFIYKPEKVAPVGTAATLDTGAFSQSISDGGRSRQPLAASFRDIASNEVFTAVVNHFKSKGAPDEPLGNANDDQGDGQGSWNARRVEAANDLADWLATNPTGVNDPDILILGDLNAYAQEDPMLALASKGYTDLIKQNLGDTSYSYAFDGMFGSLDHALASSSLVPQIGGVTQWHINADEPRVIDYDQDFNPAGYFEPNAFRASDHDPVIVSLDFSAAESCFVVPMASGGVVTFCL